MYPSPLRLIHIFPKFGYKINRLTMLYHILNGDALRMQLEGQIGGTIVIARECLVDGPIKAATLGEFYAMRAQFLENAYGSSIPDKYEDRVVPEFEKIRRIEPGAVVNLWFEEDLFCQVNCWFVLHLLQKEGVQAKLFWVLPTADVRYGFGGMDVQALLQALDNKQAISEEDLDLLSGLWPLYQANNIKQMLALVQPLQKRFPFLSTAIEAHRDRLPSDSSLGRPKESLRTIMRELGTREFGPVFQAFSQRESIYGFGDLQVKRLFDDLVSTE